MPWIDQPPRKGLFGSRRAAEARDTLVVAIMVVVAEGMWPKMANAARRKLSELLAEIRDVAHDLPAFVTEPLYRRWHLRWGATPAEVGRALPGDALVPHAQFRATRAITINASPNEVWPWLVQVGCLRGGWYSNDLLDNLGRPS